MMMSYTEKYLCYLKKKDKILEYGQQHRENNKESIRNKIKNIMKIQKTLNLNIAKDIEKIIQIKKIMSQKN